VALGREAVRRIEELDNRGVECATCRAAFLAAAFDEDHPDRSVLLRLVTIQEMGPGPASNLLRSSHYRDAMRRLQAKRVVSMVGDRVTINPPSGTAAATLRPCEPAKHPRRPSLFAGMGAGK
jgi:hypothetical protein